VLTGLLRSIDPSLKGYKFRGPEDWPELEAAL
jgi:hypothetical protein